MLTLISNNITKNNGCYHVLCSSSLKVDTEYIILRLGCLYSMDKFTPLWSFACKKVTRTKDYCIHLHLFSFFGNASHILISIYDVLNYIYLCPGSNDRGHFIFVPSVCLFICLSVCLSVVNFNLRCNIWTVRDRDFMFGMNTPLMTAFQMTPRSMTLWPWLWHWIQNKRFGLCCSRGQSQCFTSTPWFFHM